MQDIIRIGRRAVTITNPDKVIFPHDGITKRELVEYYRRIAPHMLPHLRGRPIAMERYPDGIDQPGFFQKAAAPYYPDWIRTVTVRKVGGTVRHVVCDDAATLVYIGNLACVTPHVWLSRVPKIDDPDQLVFDLDPSGDSFEPVKTTAQAFKQLLDQLGMPAYVKTTGSRGLHVAVPLRRDLRFDAVRAVALQLAEMVVSQAPSERTLELRKAMRRGRVFVDTNRNAYAQMVAPAYAVRARPGAPVSVPLEWQELSDRALRPNGVTIRTIEGRLAAAGDPWAGFWRRAVSLNRVARELKKRHAAR